MKIVDVRVHCLRIPAIPLTPAPAHTAPTRHTLVEVQTEDGRIGIGEAFRLAPGAVRALILEELRPLLLGQDAADITALAAAMLRATFRYGRKGVAVIAVSGVEVALWDLLGQSAELPLYALLGGRCRDGLRAYASLPRYGSAADAARAAAAFAEQGYGGIKLHQAEPDFVPAVRNAVGPGVAIMFDAGGAWTRRDALAAADDLARQDVLWLEEPLAPMDDYAGLAWLRARSPVRIAGGENEYTADGFTAPLAAGAFDVLQPDIIKCGGIGETRKVLAMAAVQGIEVALHAYCHGPGLAATAHLSLAATETEWIEINPIQPETAFLYPMPVPQSGRMNVTATPGLGIMLDHAVVQRFSV